MGQTAQGINTQLLLRLMQEHDMPDQAQALRELLRYVTGMERQCDAILEELRQVKDQVSKLEQKRRPAAAAFAGASQRIEAGVEGAKERLQQLRKGIEDRARIIVEDFRSAGASALRKTAEVLGVRELLCSVQENLGRAASGTKRAVERLESMGDELRTASGHLHNARRAAAGQEPRQVEQRPEGRFQSAALFPIRGVQKTLSKMQVATATAMYHVARFEQGMVDQGEVFALPAPGRNQQAGEESPTFTMSI